MIVNEITFDEANRMNCEEIDILEMAKKRFIEMLNRKEAGIELTDDIVVSSPLSQLEAIGNPGRSDFPLLKGKEVLMQAVYRGAIGQAFTPVSDSFKGTLREVLDLPLNNIFERAVLISTMNAVLRYLGLIEGTIHCRDEGPNECAKSLFDWIKGQDTNVNIGLIGMQPALLEEIVNAIGPSRVEVSDLNEAGKIRFGIEVLDGSNPSKIFERCQLIFITGSTLVNGSIDSLIVEAKRHNRDVIFYGTTIAGTAYLLNLKRWCERSG